jgi:hypothetical protein
VAKDGSVTYKLVYTHGERKGGGCGSISRVSRGSIIVFSLAVRPCNEGSIPCPWGLGSAPPALAPLSPFLPRPPALAVALPNCLYYLYMKPDCALWSRESWHPRSKV